MAGGRVLPDVMAAMISMLRADPDVSALCLQNVPSGGTPRIGVSFPETEDPAKQWKLPNYVLLVRRAGGPAANLEVGMRYARLDVVCYGPGNTIGTRRRTADQLWRTVDPVLCPPNGVPSSFRFANTEMMWIYPEAEPIPSMEPGTDWARATDT